MIPAAVSQSEIAAVCLLALLLAFLGVVWLHDEARRDEACIEDFYRRHPEIDRYALLGETSEGIEGED